MADRNLPDAPFTAEIARRAGWTPSARRHAVRTQRWDRLQRGVFDSDGPPEGPRYQRARALNLRTARGAAAACERAALSHASSMISYDLPVIGRGVNQPCVTVDSGTALRRLAKAHLHRATLDEVIVINGDRVLPVARSVVDLAREHGLVAGLGAADAALHAELTSVEELEAVLEKQRRWPGIKKARWVVGFADARTESPLESLSRFCTDRHGLPAPRPQARICDPSGVVVTRSDFYWEEFGVIGEADGAMKWENDPKARDRRDEKTYLLESLGLIVVRWGWEIQRSFGPVARRLRLGFARGARPGSSLRRWSVLPD